MKNIPEFNNGFEYDEWFDENKREKELNNYFKTEFMKEVEDE